VRLLSESEPATRSDGFGDFYRSEYRPLVGLGFVLTGDRAVAEDLAQEAFVAASREWHRIAEYDKPGAWLRRVVVNKATSWRRRRAAELRALARIGPSPASPGLLIAAENAALWSEVRSLPARQAQVIALIYLDDLTIADTADVLGCGVETVKTHLKRARSTLARRLGTNEEVT
jgi:RNA polymerase sigma-70 factor (ECF subfamily)